MVRRYSLMERNDDPKVTFYCLVDRSQFGHRRVFPESPNRGYDVPS